MSLRRVLGGLLGSGRRPRRGVAGIVDLHAHIFNMRYLPVVGNLKAVGVPESVATAAYRLLKEIADWQSENQEDLAVFTRVDTVDRIVETGSEDAGRDAIATLVPIESFSDPDVRGALDELSPAALLRVFPGKMRRILDPSQRAESGSFDLVARDERRAAFMKALDQDVHTAAILARGILDHLDWGTLKWMYLMTHPEERLMSKLAKTYPQVKLFVHSMMDMEIHYKDKAEYRVADSPTGTDQVSRTLRLTEASGGLFIAFVAWDPFRPNALKIVTNALERGCQGVKFYPPNGFRPIGNLPSDIDPDISKPPTADEVNQRNLALYRHCVDKHVPIFAHCMPGDMQAKPGYDRFADPGLWRRVLEYEIGGKRRFANLRLCFAHAGGAEAWALPGNPAGEDQFKRSYAGAVYDLCSDPRFPNVYADFGMFTVVLDDYKRAHLRDRLEHLLIGSDGKPTLFASRIAYGSDWSMLYRRQGHEKYLELFGELFTGKLAPCASGFFAANAARFLG